MTHDEECVELDSIYKALPDERKSELDAQYVSICEESGCACDWHSFLSQFM